MQISERGMPVCNDMMLLLVNRGKQHWWWVPVTETDYGWKLKEIQKIVLLEIKSHIQPLHSKYQALTKCCCHSKYWLKHSGFCTANTSPLIISNTPHLFPMFLISWSWPCLQSTLILQKYSHGLKGASTLLWTYQYGKLRLIMV